VIDEFKESGINASCSIDGRIRMGSIQHLIEIARRTWSTHPDRLLHIGKSDFSKAYRACPISADHLYLSKSIFLHHGQAISLILDF
jgi:hypothetical protein